MGHSPEGDGAGRGGGSTETLWGRELEANRFKMNEQITAPEEKELVLRRNLVEKGLQENPIEPWAGPITGA